ncbi:hypothetical protein FPK48_24865, partial [Acinetobacter baumannii]|nr:hypothetical protein [Acinetobacter baumannii]
MRKRLIAAASAAGVVVLLGPASAAAAPVLQETQVPAAGAPVAGISCTRVGPPPQRVAPSAEVLDAIDGAYRLSNGQKLELDS